MFGERFYLYSIFKTFISLAFKTSTWDGDVQEKAKHRQLHMPLKQICLDFAAHIITDSREHSGFELKLKN